jgi:1-deoxy-D-xylulose-5-phosphate synthase
MIKDGSDVAILGLGNLLPMAQELAAELEREGYSTAVVNPRFIKPLDREMLASLANRVAAIVTFEDHVKMGGFGSAVAEALEEMQAEGLVPTVPVVRIGWPDKFIEHGQVDDLRKKHGISVEAALEQVRPLLVSRSRSTLAAG